MQWSKQQEAIFHEVASGKGHLVILARAGTGKTTTIVGAFEHVNPSHKVLMVAFNKSIADELKTRAPGNVDVSTLHSFGLRTLTTGGKKARVDNHKMHRIIENIVGTNYDLREWRESVRKTVSLAKGCLAETADDIDEIVDRHAIVPPSSAGERPRFTDDVLEALRQSRENRAVIDFDDMIWLPVILDLKVKQYDRVFIDETQDLNAAQLVLAQRACKPKGRIIAVGDDRQAIYGFRGADSDAVNRIVDTLRAKVLPLSITYRCAKSIVELAQRIVPDYSAADTAIEGTVTQTDTSALLKGASPGDFVLSRTNAPLVALCMRMLSEGKRATIQGRDIGAKLGAIVKRAKAKDVSDLRDAIETWAEEECVRLERKDRDTTSVEDTAACILALSEGATSVDEVLAKIEALFSDNDNTGRIVLSSTHKAKGLERERVWMLAYTYCRAPKPGKKLTEAQKREEDNLYYVAVTRAKKELHLVTKEA